MRALMRTTTGIDIGRADYVLHATPDRAIAHFRALVEAGIQYFIVETMDAMDHDTIRLLATDVIPAIRMAARQRG